MEVAVLEYCFATRILGCSFDGAGSLVCELCRLMVIWVDCRYYLFFVFLGGARCLYLLRVTQLLPQPCGTGLRISTARAALPPSAATTPPAPRPCLLPCMAFRHPTHMFTSLSQQLRLPPPRTRLRMNTPQLLLPTHVPSPQPPVQL